MWWRGCFVSLPVHCDALVDKLDAQNFNHLFSGAYRLGKTKAATGHRVSSFGHA